MSERVLIAGGGPSGMATALFLIERGIPVTVIERSIEAHADPRAATYHPPTLEMLAPSGVTDDLHAQGIIARRWQFRDRREGLVAEFDLSLLADETPFPYRLQCEQHKLVGMMERRVMNSPLATILHGAAVDDVTQDASQVSVGVSHADGRRERLSGSFLVGADGGRSVVRKSQNIDFEGFTWPERFLVITTTFDFESLGFAYSSYTMDPIEWAATFKVPGDDGRGIWRCVFPTRTDEHESDLLDAARAAVHQRVAATYRKGRVLLAGDAAHINNPLGGMGLNFGIHDAYSLAGSLAEAIESGRDASLDRYDRQRRTVAERYLQAQTIANKQMLEETDHDRRLARQAEMRATAADPDRARQYLLRTAMIEGLRVAASID
jgi:3-(3-hydroxy-phenyl)propionate hydroxylase